MKPDNQTREGRMMADKLIAQIKAGDMVSPEVLKSAAVEIAAMLAIYEGRTVGDGPVKSVECGLISELEARIKLLASENERLRGVLVPLRDTEWEKQEPNDRDQLPDAWQAYIEEMEAFCSHYDHEARAALEGQSND